MTTIATAPAFAYLAQNHGVSISIGRQRPDDGEWTELCSGQVWSADEVAEIVKDRA